MDVEDAEDELQEGVAGLLLGSRVTLSATRRGGAGCGAARRDGA